MKTQDELILDEMILSQIGSKPVTLEGIQITLRGQSGGEEIPLDVIRSVVVESDEVVSIQGEVWVSVESLSNGILDRLEIMELPEGWQGLGTHSRISALTELVCVTHRNELAGQREDYDTPLKRDARIVIGEIQRLFQQYQIDYFMYYTM